MTSPEPSPPFDENAIRASLGLPPRVWHAPNYTAEVSSDMSGVVPGSIREPRNPVEAYLERKAAAERAAELSPTQPDNSRPNQP